MFKIEKFKDKYRIVFLSKSYILMRMGTPPKSENIQYDENDHEFEMSKNLFFASELELEQWQLNRLLTLKFNAASEDELVTEFDNEEDAKNALEWVESMYMMRKLEMSM